MILRVNILYIIKENGVEITNNKIDKFKLKILPIGSKEENILVIMVFLCLFV